MSYREQGKSALGTVLQQDQNIRVIEKYVYDISTDEATDDDAVEARYRRNLYQTVGDVLDGEKLKDILANIKAGKVGWNHPKFRELQDRLEEQDNFIENPFEVEEGVLECSKCKSKRVFSYTKQCRGSDEPMTTFATCVSCSAQWKYDG